MDMLELAWLFAMTKIALPIVAIMQPTYLPWMGYMAMIDVSESFVFLDTVQYDKRSWQQRNRVKTANGPHWLTVPVLSKGTRGQKILSVSIDESRKFGQKHVSTLRNIYVKTPFYSELEERLFPILLAGHTRLANLNISIIKELVDWLGIKTKILNARDLSNSDEKLERLSIIAEQLGAGTYLSAPGSYQYLSQATSFKEKKIDVRYLGFDHPEYPQQFGEFISHLSVIDALCNVGAETTLKMIRNSTHIDEPHLLEKNG
jgi:hypothetical protein